ncbi:MAG TPA: metallophosphoesterase [Polyangiaceae bacterium]
MSLGRLLGFLAVFGTILGAAHYYVWLRLVRAAHLPPPWSTVGTWILALMGVALILGMPATFLLPRRAASPVAWVSYTWMGLLFFLFLLALATDVVRVGIEVVHRVATSGLLDPDRRVTLQRILAAVIAAGTIGFGVVGLSEGLREVRVKRIRIALRRVRPSRVGYTIVQLSDVHIGPTIGRAFLEDVVARTNALKPDLIVITGDLVDGSVEHLKDAVAPLADLRAVDGVYFVTGNHEYFSGVDEWLAYLKTLGVRVLRNERVSIGGADGFDLAGVDDWTAARYGHGHGADLSRALQGRDRNRGLILLAHQPKQVFEAAEADVDLQLSGHTHGGQMFPFGYLVKLQQPYVGGFHMHQGTALYVSRGTGYWGPPMRVGAPAEITHIELAMA